MYSVDSTASLRHGGRLQQRREAAALDGAVEVEGLEANVVCFDCCKTAQTAINVHDVCLDMLILLKAVNANQSISTYVLFC